MPPVHAGAAKNTRSAAGPMHKVLIINSDQTVSERLDAFLSGQGYRVRLFHSISQSHIDLEGVSAIIVSNDQSAEKNFRTFLKMTEHIPKIVIDYEAPARGIHRWLKNDMTFTAVKPANRELLFLLKNAIRHKEVSSGYNEARQRLLEAERELALFEAITKDLTSSLDLDSIIENIMKHIVEITGAKGWSLYLFDEEFETLYLARTHRRRKGKGKKITVELGDGIAGWVAKEGVPVIIPDVSQDRRFCAGLDEGEIGAKKSLICVPLKSKGRILGVIEIMDKKRNQPFNKYDLGIILKIVDHASLAIENASLYQKMAELAITDDLTKLFNSRYLNRTMETEIARCERYDTSVSLIFMDIDYFKNINDHYGHLIGSKVLVEMGQLLIKGLRSIDIVSRYGGDEFVIVLPQTPPSTAHQIAERLRKSIHKHVFLRSEGLNLRLTASFGVASYPESARSKEELLRLADEAMYRVKNKTRDGVYTISVVD